MKAYYEDYPEQAKQLVLRQLADGWTVVAIMDYFQCLGYDYFFVKSIIPPELLN